MKRETDADFVGSRYRAWIRSLAHERPLPTPRVSVALFTSAYAIAFTWRAFGPAPWPFLLGLFATVLLSVRVTNLLLVRLLRGDLRRPAGQRFVYAGLAPLTYGTTILVLAILGVAYVLAYRWLPGPA